MTNHINNDKIILYESEIPYYMVCNLAKMYWPNQYKNELSKYGLVLIKPEAIITGKTSEIFSILHTEGFELIYFLRKTINALQVAEMWKFSWQHSSLEHIFVNQKLFSICESFVLILRSQYPTRKSACEILTELKGSALESERKPYQIRWKIKPINYVLNYLHTSDDSIDFLRELGILLEWNELIQAFEAMASNHAISYPIGEKPPLLKGNYTLDNWCDNICTKMEVLNISPLDKIYIIKNMQSLKKHIEYKITLNLLLTLCRYELIEWNFETIVILTNHINYLK